MKHWPFLIPLLTVVVLLGCEDRAIPPGDYEIDPPEEEAPVRPTTQELLEGPREPLRLDTLPLTLDVPESWEIHSLRADIVFLQGPTPSGDVQIQLASRPMITREQLELRHSGAESEAADNPDILRIDMRQVNNLTVLERLEVEPLLPRSEMPQATADEAADDPAAPPLPGTPLRWTIGVYVRTGEQFEAYELNFIGLTLEQYEQDEQFLREIIETVRHDANAPAPQRRSGP